MTKYQAILSSQRQPHQVLSPLVACLFLLLLSACASNKDKEKEIQTYDDISLTTQNETIRFNYTLYWILPTLESGPRRNTRMSKSIRKQELILQQMRSQSPELAGLRLDGKTKVKLEDIAVLKLARKLQLRGVCTDGHAIEQTYWKERSIKLLGQCL